MRWVGHDLKAHFVVFRVGGFEKFKSGDALAGGERLGAD